MRAGLFRRGGRRSGALLGYAMRARGSGCGRCRRGRRIVMHLGFGGGLRRGRGGLRWMARNCISRTGILGHRACVDCKGSVCLRACVGTRRLGHRSPSGKRPVSSLTAWRPRNHPSPNSSSRSTNTTRSPLARLSSSALLETKSSVTGGKQSALGRAGVDGGLQRQLNGVCVAGRQGMRDVRITSRMSPTSGLEGADGPLEAILA